MHSLTRSAVSRGPNAGTPDSRRLVPRDAELESCRAVNGVQRHPAARATALHASRSGPSLTSHARRRALRFPRSGHAPPSRDWTGRDQPGFTLTAGSSHQVLPPSLRRPACTRTTAETAEHSRATSHTMQSIIYKFRLALIQLFVTPVKSDNLNRACKLIREAAQQGAKVVALPECFNSPYGTKFFPEYAEKIPGESTKVLSDIAKECGIYLIGGSIPEDDSGKLYNTCAVFGPDGKMLVKHRKIHLFDINVPGKICFQESETLSPGDSFSIFDTPYCKVGVGICYDIRFAELAQIYTRKGCQLLVYPGAFNMTTGPAHWELLQRSRALDNQVYVATASPARDEKASYVAWGHSSVVNPWGEVIAKAGHEETVTYTDIDLQYLADVRQQIPIHAQKRTDLYHVEAKKE